MGKPVTWDVGTIYSTRTTDYSYPDPGNIPITQALGAVIRRGFIVTLVCKGHVRGLFIFPLIYNSRKAALKYRDYVERPL